MKTDFEGKHLPVKFLLRHIVTDWNIWLLFWALPLTLYMASGKSFHL